MQQQKIEKNFLYYHYLLFTVQSKMPVHRLKKKNISKAHNAFQSEVIENWRQQQKIKE